MSIEEGEYGLIPINLKEAGVVLGEEAPTAMFRVGVSRGGAFAGHASKASASVGSASMVSGQLAEGLGKLGNGLGTRVSGVKVLPSGATNGASRGDAFAMHEDHLGQDATLKLGEQACLGE
ncbi:unnamed protein product [Ilex paraguariensis]